MDKPIYIYNSLERKKIPLKPAPAELKMYVCGPTVYDEPHIGHARSAYIFDVIRRYLIYKGYKVKFVRNVTDVDDKIIDKARKEYTGEDLNIAFKKVAEKYLDSYHKALGELGIAFSEPEIIEPKASEYIGKMIEFIDGLIKRGVAYQSGGDVYFDITKAKSYGKLSNQSLDKLEVGVRVAAGENKKNPLDFALWKSTKEDEPFWESPWGKGRPGWHIECSAMSSDLLGDEFDIHGGGIDLIFPHHENEIAQSEGAGKKFAQIWIHHGLLTINGQKMAKSLGNFVTIKDFINKYKYPDFLKLFFLSAHYSNPIDYTEEKIEDVIKAFERIFTLYKNINRKLAGQNSYFHAENFDEIASIKNKFIEAMDDDFNTAQGLSFVFELVTIANKRLDDLTFIYNVKETLELFLEEVLGFSSLFLLLRADSIYSLTKFKDIKIEDMIKEREHLRREKRFLDADKIRIELERQGIILEDTKEGTAWRRKL